MHTYSDWTASPKLTEALLISTHLFPPISHALPAPGTIVHICLRILPMDIASVFLDVISSPEEPAITSLGTVVIVSKINYPIYFK